MNLSDFGIEFAMFLGTVIVAIMIFILARKEDRDIERMTRAISVSLINEKTAVMYRDSLDTKGWKDDEEVSVIVKRIESDLRAVGNIARYAEEGQEGRLGDAVGLLEANMKDRFPSGASSVREAFAAIKWPLPAEPEHRQKVR